MTTPEKKPEQDITRTLELDAAQPRRRVARLLVCIAAAVVVAAGIAAWALYGRGSAGGNIRYDTQPVTRGDLIKTVSATGTLQPVKEVSVGIEVSGTYDQIGAFVRDLENKFSTAEIQSLSMGGSADDKGQHGATLTITLRVLPPEPSKKTEAKKLI